MVLKLLAVAGGILVGIGLLSQWPGAAVALLHLLTAALAALSCRRDGRLMAIRAGILSLVLPVVGPAGLLLATAKPGDRQELISSYRTYIAYADHVPRPAFRDDDDGLQRELSVQPLVDDLYRGDFGLRQAAAETLATMATLPAVTLLRAALTDGDSETRLCASLALVKAEASFAGRLTSGRERTAADPGDGPAWLALAQATGDYADSGLAAREMAQACWFESAHAAQRVLDVRSDVGSVLPAERLLVRAHLRLGKPAAALATLDRALATTPDDGEMLLAACEAYFTLGDFDRLQTTARHLSTVAESDSPGADVADYWRDHGR